MADFLTIATALIERGFSVIPIEPRGKRPVPGIGAKSRIRSLEVLIEHSPNWASDCNVAICADENIVILETDDFERLNDVLLNGCGHSFKSMASPPGTLMACGSSENRPHLFFKRTEKATNVGNLVVPGLFEARFNNQYVVGPGSVHPSGAVYRWLSDVPIVPIPDWLVSELVRLATSQRLNSQEPRTIEAVGGRIPEGSRHYFLIRELGKCWTGRETEEELNEKADELNALCDPPKDTAHVRQCVRDIMRREPYNPGPAVVIGAEEVKAAVGPQTFRPHPDQEYIIPGTDNLEGWFVKGELNLVVGASGAGKTTIMLQLFEQVRQGQAVFKHSTIPQEYRVLMHDRSARGFERTAKRMQLSAESRRRIHRLTRTEQKSYARDVIDDYLKALERKGKVPDAVFVEGLDLWARGDINRKEVVEDFCSDLQELAERWEVAIIGSVGTPKQKKKDGYMLSRDNVNGSAAWGRKVETILFLSLSNPENPNSARKMEVLPRNGPAEVMYLAFKDGLLVETEPPEKEEKPLAGVKETRAQKTDKQAELITYIQSLPVGARLPVLRELSYYGSTSTVSRYLDELSSPLNGWVVKSENGWIVRDRNQKGE